MSKPDPYTKAVMTIAERVLAAHFRPQSVTFKAPDGKRMHARFVWPGVLIVTRRDDAQEVCRQRPHARPKPGPDS